MGFTGYPLRYLTRLGPVLRVTGVECLGNEIVDRGSFLDSKVQAQLIRSSGSNIHQSLICFRYFCLSLGNAPKPHVLKFQVEAYDLAIC